MSARQQTQNLPVVRVSRRAEGPLTSGHPWFFREEPIQAPVGTLVQLVNGHGHPVGFGLVDEGPIAVRMLGRGTPPSRPLRDLVAERVLQADQARIRLVPPATTAYRVVAGAGDGLPGVVIDRYGELAVLRLYSRAYSPHLGALVRAIRRLPWVEAILQRFGVQRVDDQQGAEVLWGPAPPERLVVSERGIFLLVRPWTGQKTGLFLDQREHRHLVGQWAAGRRVANLFGYTGGFSVAAALGGAARVVTVDLSAKAIADARETFQLNGISDRDHGFEVADVFTWSPSESFDLWIADPPSLTHAKHSDGAAKNAYRKLHHRLGQWVPHQGLLATSSCSARLSLTTWRQAVTQGLSRWGDWSWHWVSTEPTDHPVGLAHHQGHYLKFALLRNRSALRHAPHRCKSHRSD